MMLPAIRFFSICIFLCVPFLTKAQFSVADGLFRNGNYADAAIEYERVIFKNKEPEVQAGALLRKSYAYKQLHRFTEAQQTLERAEPAGLADSLQFRLRYETALNAYLAGNFSDAENHLLQLQYFLPDTTLTNQTLYLQILTLHGLQRYQQADSVFEKYARLYQLPAEAVQQYRQQEVPKLKNPLKAERLAMFLPGAGQLYAGYPGKGITAAALNLAAFSFGVYSIWQGHYLLGFFSGFGLLQAFYFGSVRHTQYLVEKRNSELISAHNAKLKELILLQESSIRKQRP